MPEQSSCTQPTSYPARFSKQIGAGHKYVSPDHALYQELVRTSYEGLVHDKSGAMSAELHTTAAAAFTGLQKHQLFQHDITNQLGLGKPCNRTMVKRTLVGNAGFNRAAIPLWHLCCSSRAAEHLSPVLLFSSIYRLD